MANNYIQPGQVLEHTLSGDVTSGDVLVLGDSVGVALQSGGSGDTIPVAVEGVFQVDKTSGTAWNLGDKLDWDVSASKFAKGLTAATGDVEDCAIAAAAAASDATTGYVKLTNPGVLKSGA